MTQITLDIEDKSLVPILKGIIKRLSGVSISSTTTKISIKNAKMNKRIDTKKAETYSTVERKKIERRLKSLSEVRERKFDSSLIDLSDERTNYLMSK